MDFATSKNKYLAAGDDHMVKFWDMDREELLMTTDSDGHLPVSFLIDVLFSLSFLKSFLNHHYMDGSFIFNIAVIIFKARPKIQFNKDGTLLAVIAVGHTIKILGPSDGPNMLQSRQEFHLDSSCEVLSEALKKVGNLVLSADLPNNSFFSFC